MKNFFFIFIFFAVADVYSQSNAWSFIKGDTLQPDFPIYGSQGMVTLDAKPGGRQGSASWTDTSGNIWMYGGYGEALDTTGYLSDLWKYNKTAKQWVWIRGTRYVNSTGIYGRKGSSTTSTRPGARYGSVSWLDGSGNLWLFGGEGYAATKFGYLSDLWKYEPALNRWTWISGDSTVNKLPIVGIKGSYSSTNNPGARWGASGCLDKTGNLLLFGGSLANTTGYSLRNDLWKYDTVLKKWSWISGDNVNNIKAVYGTMGTSSSNNKIGARYFASLCSDGANNIWIFGGFGRGQSGTGTLNDLWLYKPSIDKWTWMKGAKGIIDDKGFYGTKGTASATNTPGSRQSSIFFNDKKGNLWLFGGETHKYDYIFQLNDLWKYNLGSNQWTWIKGDSTSGALPVHGGKGVYAQTYDPGARAYAVASLDTNSFILFGGLTSELSSNYPWKDLEKGDNDFWQFNFQSQNWAWVAGGYRDVGIYGQQGQVAVTNKPGARSGSVSWRDLSGNLWMFGGEGFDSAGNHGLLNDLWKYDIATSSWTWVRGNKSINPSPKYGTKGVSSSTSLPGGRSGSTSWVDLSGNLWLFGGQGSAGDGYGDLNDFWKFNIATKSWVWVSGDTLKYKFTSNTPAARSWATGWTDRVGNLWLFGGYLSNIFGTSGTDGLMNDLWKYNPSTNVWTFVKGSHSWDDDKGRYGTLGQSSLANFPSARAGSAGWIDSSGKLWLFGGTGLDVGWDEIYYDCLNDLWMYNPVNNRWTWMGGDQYLWGGASYGIKGVSSTTNKPGPRQGSISWTDKSNNLWLFGGTSTESEIKFPPDWKNWLGNFNDLWKYNIQTKEWTWMSGDNFQDAEGRCGSPGIPDVTNSPGARTGSIGWNDKKGNFWLWGGSGFSSQGNGKLNDLWKYFTGDTVSFARKSVITKPEITKVHWRIFPNPAKTFFNIQLSQRFSNEVNLQLLDITGKVILEKIIGPQQSSANIPIRDVPNGTYTVRLVSKDVFWNQQLVIIK